ncbi:MAG: hypothetical protein HY261_06705, partial [Chloroflexi bacterium]|nr:hypothetical protein [Chloroflexota bacterium]
SSLIPSETYNILIEKLDLSARTLNCLKRSKINKVGEILEKSQDELLKIKNFGEKSLQELNERLAAMGIKRPEEATEAATSGSAAEGAAPAPATPAMSAAERRAAKAGRETIRDLSALKALLGDESETADEDSKG